MNQRDLDAPRVPPYAPHAVLNGRMSPMERLEQWVLFPGHLLGRPRGQRPAGTEPLGDEWDRLLQERFVEADAGVPGMAIYHRRTDSE